MRIFHFTKLVPGFVPGLALGLLLVFAQLLYGCAGQNRLTADGLDQAEQTEQENISDQNSQNSINADGLSEEGRTVYLYLLLNNALSEGDTATAMQSIQELLYLAPTEDLFREAVSIYEFSNQPQQAIDAARTGVRLYPLDMALHMMLSNILARNGQVDEAITLLQDFSAFYGKNQTGLSKIQKQKDLGELRLMLIRLFMNDGRYNEAEAAIQALPATERTASVMYYEAEICKATGRKAEAQSKLEELVRRHPNFTEAWLALAAEAESGKNFIGAAEYYRKALESNDMPQIFLLRVNALLAARQYKTATRLVINSSYIPEVKLQCALLFMEKKRNNEAGEILLTLEDNYSLLDDVNFYLALLAYDSDKNIPEALERLDNIAPSTPNRAKVLRLKSLLLIKQKDYEQARVAVEVLRDEFPEDKENWFFLLELYAGDQMYPEMENASREALRQWPDEVEFLSYLGFSLGLQKKKEESLVVMEQALLIDGDNPSILNYIGYYLADDGLNLDRAYELISKALRLDPDNYAIIDSMAWVLYKRGEYGKAWDEIRRCLEISGTDAEIWEHYGDIAAALNKTSEAVKGYEKCLELEPENPDEIVRKLNGLLKRQS
ncbi:MAG: tetratricopeptide repeat protein [Deltaproteobacteria bacterium]|jgi:tetratricopeptide (TPR) repeat protein|nr:tetratricopeptide repeat protein [Deltaproteobacteria bacterium]